MVTGKLLIKEYVVHVYGWQSALYFASSPGKARAQAWRDYSEARGSSFGDFLLVSRVSKCRDTHPDFGRPILVNGKPAFRISSDRQYVRFAWPDSDHTLISHPSDVSVPPISREDA